MNVHLFKQGKKGYEPVSHICFRGLFHEVAEKGIRYVTDLNGALKWVFIEESNAIFEAGTLFRRTIGGRWLLYDGSLYSESFDLTGRHYIPIPMESHGSHLLNGEKGLLKKALIRWDRWLGCQSGEKWKDDGQTRQFFLPTQGLRNREIKLRGILKATVPVVPPEAIFWDYDVIPIVVADGCVSNCTFCCVKTGGEFQERPLRQIKESVQRLKGWLGDDHKNFSSLFLGQNDALYADTGLLQDVAHYAYEEFHMERAYVRPSGLFMFGSPLSLIRKKMSDFDMIDSMPFEKVHINVGIESLDPHTLQSLGRPFDPELLYRTLERIEEVHANTTKIEISINFVLGPGLHRRHIDLLVQYLGEYKYRGKGYVFLSPLFGQYKGLGEIKREVFTIKPRSRPPLFLYVLVALV